MALFAIFDFLFEFLFGKFYFYILKNIFIVSQQGQEGKGKEPVAEPGFGFGGGHLGKKPHFS